MSESYSATSPKQAAKPGRSILSLPQSARIPQLLTERNQWVLWCFEWSKTKWTKVPERRGGGASSTDPRSWTDYFAALTAYWDSDWADGIGYVFNAGDGLTGIDLDRALTPDGKLKSWAVPIYTPLAAHYWEISPSGNGIKGFISGKMEDFKGRKRVGIGDDGDGAIEMYSTGRFFTVTGRTFGGEA